MSSAVFHFVIFSLYIYEIQYVFPQQSYDEMTVTRHIFCSWPQGI